MRVGLTGNIGSGKTLVSKVFQTLGIPVFYADQVGRTLLSSPLVMEAIVRHFGENLIGDDACLDRKRLGQIVFSDPDARNWLNNLIHPKVWEAFETWHQEQNAIYTLHEAAILVEHGYSTRFDKVILITAPESIRMHRVMTRDGIDEKAFRERANAQWSEEQLLSFSDFVIQNDGNTALLPQVLEIHQQLMHTIKGEISD